MMKRLLATLLLVSACNGTPGLPTPGDSDAADSEAPRGDTFVRNPGDTDAKPDDTDTGFTESDTGGGGPDTADCRLGFLEDCDGRCFPDHFVGDGFCDDGTLPANYDCDLWNHDHGDCTQGGSDTDSTPDDCGQFTLQFQTVIYGNEIGWHIDEISASGAGTIVRADVAKSAFSAYIQPDPHLYTHALFLPPGHYQFVGQDSWVPADGWHGASFHLIDDATGISILDGGPEMVGAKNYFVWYFDVSCDRPKCSVDVITTAGDDVEESGWQLYTTAGSLRAEMLPGAMQAGTVSSNLELYEGNYQLRMRDLGGDGWEGGKIEARYHSGLLMTARGLPSGSDGSVPFTVDCGPPSNQTAFDAPGAPKEPTSCTGIRLDLFQPGANAANIGWSLWRISDWTQVATRAPGTYSDVAGYLNVVDVQSGSYFLQATATGTGWGAGRLAIEDPNGTALMTMLMPEGLNGGRYIDFACPEAGDTDVDDTDVTPQDCQNGAVRDCGGICFPAVFKGDHFCDDGSTWSANFACAEHAWDGGDCQAP